MAAKRQTGSLRIIGGRWRSRRIRIVDRPGLRPTPDRVRETLFNWLTPYLDGARVLDLCAGTGALALEALSRGADRAVLIEPDAWAADAIDDAIRRLAADARLLRQDAQRFLGRENAALRAGDRFDLVFVDPPYDSGLHTTLCARLQDGAWLAPNALVYVETDARIDNLEFPDLWTPVRRKQAGQVVYRLLRGPA